MQPALRTIAELGSANHGVVSTRDLRALGLPRTTKGDWITSGRLIRLGTHSFTLPGTVPTWERSAAAAQADLDGHGYLAGRTGAFLLGLDGFEPGPIEALTERTHRGVRADLRLATTDRRLDRGDTVIVKGLRCLTAERMILDSPLFGFTRRETENAIDSALRLRLVHEQRLRTRVIARHRRSINHGRTLLDALVDAGGTAASSDGRCGSFARPGCLAPHCSSPIATANESSLGWISSSWIWWWRCAATARIRRVASCKPTSNDVPS